MFLERIEDRGLAHFSYVVGAEGTREAAIVDPRRDVDVYLRFLAERRLELRYVLETHIHADFASGAHELALSTGAELCASGHDAGETYEVRFPHRDVYDGDVLELGALTIRALHTPGHTPEHLSFLLFDRDRSAEVPVALLSGDFLFVGSVGRPDLLGAEVKRELAGRLHDSLRTALAGLPDGMEVHPAHGAGSMCGSGMSGRPRSTLGYERAANPYLDPRLDRGAFVERLLASAPPFPPYYRRMKRMNADGPRVLAGLPGQEGIPAPRFRGLVEAGHHVIDLRDHLAFGGGHVPGAFGIGAGSNLSTWAAWVVPYEVPLLLVAADEEAVPEAVRSLVRVGLDDVVGYLEGGIAAWRGEGFPLAHLPQVTAEELHRQLQSDDGLRVIDVRSDQEWSAGHIQGALHVMGGQIEDRLQELPPKDAPLAVVCGGGYRSTVAASVLERHGFTDLRNVTGGMGGWKRAGLPTVGP